MEIGFKDWKTEKVRLTVENLDFRLAIDRRKICTDYIIDY